MPEISRFFGIVIRMFYNDHAPPHFHAEYGEHEVLLEIETLNVYAGQPHIGMLCERIGRSLVAVARPNQSLPWSRITLWVFFESSPSHPSIGSVSD
jgi:hypothetical protein